MGLVNSFRKRGEKKGIHGVKKGKGTLKDSLINKLGQDLTLENRGERKGHHGKEANTN